MRGDGRAAAPVETFRRVVREKLLLAGIDIGTTNCRCLLADRDGMPVGAASVAVRIDVAPPDRAEVQPEEWWQATCSVIRAALANAGRRPEDVVAVGLSGLMHAPVLVDGEGRPLAAAQLWMDQRCAPEAVALQRRFADLGRRADLRTSVSAPKLAWLSARAPAAVARARHMLLPKDFVRLRLTGESATDPSDAVGTGLYDAADGTWMSDLVSAVGLRPDQLPTVRRSDDCAGFLTHAAAAATGLGEGTPVATGGADTLCTRLGIGQLDVGRVLVYLGTAAWVAVVEGVDEMLGVRAADVGATTATGSALGWVGSLLGGANAPLDYASMDELAAGAPIGSSGVTFLPHLMGERGPDPAPGARAAWTGLTLAHGREHVVRAVMEGVAFQLRRLCEAGAPGLPEPGVPALAVGGICRSSLWLQMLADVGGVVYEIPRQPEAAAQGAALLGGRAAGVLGARAIWANPVVRRVEPDAAARRSYEAPYQRFLRAERACSALGEPAPASSGEQGGTLSHRGSC